MYSSCLPKGLTLTEIVVSMVIVSTLLVASLHALQSHLKQADRSHLKSQAVNAAEKLLADWFDDGLSSVPSQSVGVVNHGTIFRWETSVTQRQPELGFQVVRLRLFAKDDSDVPLVSVDVAAIAENLQ